MIKYLSILFLLFQSFTALFAQRDVKPRPELDIQSYIYDIRLNDSTDVIDVTASIEILFKKSLTSFNLDLIEQDKNANGMKVTQVRSGNTDLKFHQDNDRLYIESVAIRAGDRHTFKIKYHGVPKDGLIIGTNKFGDRTFFGDNWPNRARNWLVCVDHPLDKATVSFRVTAPSHYQVIATGKLIERTDLDSGYRLHITQSKVPLPTKVMVIGAGRFAIQNLNEVAGIPVSSWVYPQNKKAGFYDYALAVPVLSYFIENIGPYPFQKLANVQSKTRYGGMENAGNIFYYEASVTGKRKSEALIAHEIAHQWFGDSATESDWKDLWLSEGFATYFTDLYFEHQYGAERLKQRMADQRKKIIRFSKNWNRPVIDTLTNDLIKLLNANSYEKGAWVLHMLRHEIGNDLFWKGIRMYYKKYALSNASTNDLIAVFEKTSGKNLKPFFNQWLKQPGHPVLKTTYIEQNGTVLINLKQVQKNYGLFQFSLEVQIVYLNGNTEHIRLDISQAKQSFSIPVKGKFKTVFIDPNVHLLFEKVAE